MKKLVILCVMVLACQVGAAQGVSDLFSKYAHVHNAESVNVSSLLIKFAKLFADSEDARVLKGINSVKILDLDDCSTEVKSQFTADVDRLETNGYEALMEADKNEAKTRFLLKMKDDVVSEFLIVSGGSDDCALVQIKGKMTLQDIVDLAENSKKGNGNINISF